MRNKKKSLKEKKNLMIVLEILVMDYLQDVNLPGLCEKCWGIIGYR